MSLPGTGDNEADYKTLLATFTKENQKPKPVAKPDDGTVSYKERWEQDQARLVKATLGPEVEPARTAFDRAYEMDQTPFGFALALESYAQARMAGATPAEAASSQAPTRAQAVTPRVDSNQSDVNPDQVQTQIDQARQQGDLAKALRLQREHPEMRLRV
jgi:hypothetical protein